MCIVILRAVTNTHTHIQKEREREKENEAIKSSIQKYFIGQRKQKEPTKKQTWDGTNKKQIARW